MVHPEIHLRQLAIALLASLAATAAVAPINAADAQAEPDTRTEAAWSSDELDAFAAASVAVSETHLIWERKIETARTRQEQQELLADRNEALFRAIEGEGLSVGEFKRIEHAAQRDDDLYAEIVERMRQLRER